MTRLAKTQELEGEEDKLLSRVAKLQERARVASGAVSSSPLGLLAPHKRTMYGQMIELIYECSANRVAAKALVDRILEKITITDDGAPQRSKKRRPGKGKELAAATPRQGRTRRHKRRSPTTPARSRPKPKR
jgi:hypothetical protein